MTAAEALDLAQFAGAAVVGAVGAVIGMYRIFIPRRECDLRHKPIHELRATVNAQGLAASVLHEKFLELRRDVRWSVSIQAAIARHLNIPIPEQPREE